MIRPALLDILKRSTQELYENSYREYMTALKDARSSLHPSYNQIRIEEAKSNLEHLFYISNLLNSINNQNYKEETK